MIQEKLCPYRGLTAHRPQGAASGWRARGLAVIGVHGPEAGSTGAPLRCSLCGLGLSSSCQH